MLLLKVLLVMTWRQPVVLLSLASPTYQILPKIMFQSFFNRGRKICSLCYKSGDTYRIKNNPMNIDYCLEREDLPRVDMGKKNYKKLR